jgi:hypothetical protein
LLYRKRSIIEIRYPAADVGLEPIVGYYDADALDGYFQSVLSDLGARNAAVTIIDPRSKEEITTIYEDHRPPTINRDYFTRLSAYTMKTATDGLHRINARDALKELFKHIPAPRPIVAPALASPDRSAQPRLVRHGADVFQREGLMRAPLIEAAQDREEVDRIVRTHRQIIEHLGQQTAHITRDELDQALAQQATLEEIDRTQPQVAAETEPTDEQLQELAQRIQPIIANDLNISDTTFSRFDHSDRTFERLLEHISPALRQSSNLNITGLSHLSKLPGNLGELMPNLKKLDLMDIPQLQSLADLPSLPNLEELSLIVAIRPFTRLTSFEGLTLPDGSLKYPNLKRLYIIGAPNLISFSSLPSFPRLEKLVISSATSTEGLPVLPALQELRFNEGRQNLRGDQIPEWIRRVAP